MSGSALQLCTYTKDATCRYIRVAARLKIGDLRFMKDSENLRSDQGSRHLEPKELYDGDDIVALLLLLLQKHYTIHLWRSRRIKASILALGAIFSVPQLLALFSKTIQALTHGDDSFSETFHENKV
jgi:hypothetical protein